MLTSEEIEYVGSGVMRMRESMKEEHLPDPDFGLEGMFNIALKRPVEYEDDMVNVDMPKLSEKQQKVFDLIRNNEKITTDEIGKTLSISKRYTIKIIGQLKQSGHVERIGMSKSGSWKLFTDS